MSGVNLNDSRPSACRRWVRRGATYLVAGAALLASGCMKAKEMSGVRSRIGKMRQDIAAVQSKVLTETDVNTGGGNFNEPVTGWILAAGYASVPATIFLYLLMHRFRTFRRVKECIRGAPA